MGKETDKDGEWEVRDEGKCKVRLLVKPSEEWEEKMAAGRMVPPTPKDCEKAVGQMLGALKKRGIDLGAEVEF